MYKIGIGISFFGIRNLYGHVIQFSKSVSILVRLKSSKLIKIGIGKKRFNVNWSIPSPSSDPAY